MKKLFKFLFLLPLIGGVFAFGGNSSERKTTQVEASETTHYPRNGQSGNLLFINPYSFFFEGDAKLACCFWNSSGSAWTEKIDDKISSGSYRVMIPYKNGEGTTWSHFKICRYNSLMDPTVNGDYGVYNATDSISLGNLIQAQNTFVITGYGENSKLNYSLATQNYYGVQSEEHLYLDLSSFTSWENEYAKFAIYFGYPSSNSGTAWSQANDIGNNYSSSFLWKVNGQSNEHLYECIVPLNYGNSVIWNLVIPVRMDASATSPSWDSKWNQTQDLLFNSSNHECNMIKITDWGTAEFVDKQYNILKTTRINFFGQYFLDTVTCSGHGNSDSTTSSQWNAVKSEYVHHLARLYQGDIWSTTANKTGSTIAQAMYRYDYILFYKHYDVHEDFINRADPNSGYQPISNELAYGIQSYADFKKSSIYIVIIASYRLWYSVWSFSF